MIFTFYRKTNGHLGIWTCEAYTVRFYYKVSQFLLNTERFFPGSDKKEVLRLCRKFTGERPCQSVSNVIEITLCHSALL